MGVEVLLKVSLPRDSHLFLKLCKVLADRHFSLGKLPCHVIATVNSLDHLVVIVDLQKPQCNLSVVRCIGVLQGVDVVHDLLDLLHALRGANPQLALRILQALGLDVFHLGYSIVTLLSPFEFFIQEVKHGEIKAPEVVTAGQIDTQMGMQRGKRNCASEVGALPLWYRVVVAVQMLLCKTEVHYVDLCVFLVHHEVRGLHISMNKASLMDAVDCCNHLHQDLNRYLEVVSLVEAPPGFCQVDPQQVHDDEVLLSVLNILVCIGDMGEA